MSERSSGGTVVVLLTVCSASMHSPPCASSAMTSLGLLVSKKSIRPLKNAARLHVSRRTSPRRAARRSSASTTSGKTSLAEGWSVSVLARQRSASDSEALRGSSFASARVSVARESQFSSSSSGSRLSSLVGLFVSFDTAGSDSGISAMRSSPPNRSRRRRPSGRASCSVPAGFRPSSLRRAQVGGTSGWFDAVVAAGWISRIVARTASTSLRLVSGGQS